MLEAKARADIAYPVTAFGGRGQYVRDEWRAVPAGFEDEAKANHMLIVRAIDEPQLPKTADLIDATDAAIKLAEEKSIDLSLVKGSGVGGRIGVPDVRAFITAQGEAEEPIDGEGEEQNEQEEMNEDLGG